MKAMNLYIVRSKAKDGNEITPVFRFDFFDTYEKCIEYANEDNERVYDIFVLLASKTEMDLVKTIE